MRQINEIIIHCSATRPQWMLGSTGKAKVAEIKRWHTQERKWSDIGYHYIIDRDGSVYAGRSIERVGAHAKGRNIGSVGICLIGGHGSSASDAFPDHFTSLQDRAARKLIKSLQRDYPINLIRGHNDYAPKACPGFTVATWLKQAPPVNAPAIGETNAFAEIISKLFASLFPKAKG